jgi:hypothetical protein
MGRDGASIGDGVGNEEDHKVDATVASLQCDPPIKGLEIGQSHLGLNGNQAVQGELSIPSACVGLVGDRHLRPPSGAGWSGSVESLEQLGVSRISNRVSIEIRSTGELETDRRARTCELSNGHVWEGGALDSTEGRLAHSDRFRRGSQTQARAPPGQPDLRSRDALDPQRLLHAAVQPPLARCHGADDRVGDLPVTHLAFIGRWATERTGESSVWGCS